MKTAILIIGDPDDPHVKAVSGHIDRVEYDLVFLDPANGDTGSLLFSYDPFSLKIVNSGEATSSEEIKSVWWRVKPNLSMLPKTIEEVETKQFIQREWLLAFEAMSFVLDDCFWINRRDVDILLRSKPFQLYKAQSFGFEIPSTIIGNDFAAIEQHFASRQEVLYKPLSYFAVPPEKILYSNAIPVADLPGHHKNISIAPCIFQAYVDKQYELRITIIGAHVFPVRIHSQENPNAALDWRREQLNLQYEVVTLDAAFEKKLLTFHRATGLVYGAYDFIVGVDGKYTFLEVNPVGQWLWLESILKLDISEKMAGALMQGR
jgi:hypothetical protein